MNNHQGNPISQNDKSIIDAVNAVNKDKEAVAAIGEKVAAELEEDVIRFLEVPGVLADWQIRDRLQGRAGSPQRLVLSPFFDGECPEGTISYGLSSYGYDARVGRNYKVFTNCSATIVDPKAMKPDRFTTYADVDTILIPPNSFALAESIEYVEVPTDVIVIVLGKSTYARCGINLNMTPLEPGWRGKITLEIANMTPLPAKIYSDEGIGQMLFLKASAQCRKHYGNKNRPKYQDQTGLTLARV